MAYNNLNAFNNTAAYNQLYNNHNLLGNGHHHMNVAGNSMNSQQQQQQHSNNNNNNNMHRIPNRIFVGGIPQNTSQNELRDYFSQFGLVKDARIIMDQHGNSKGFGFVTYNNEHDATKVLSVKEEDLVFKENKLNVGHAYRKNNPTTPGMPTSMSMQHQQHHHNHQNSHQHHGAHQFLQRQVNTNASVGSGAGLSAFTGSSQTSNNYMDTQAQLHAAFQQQQYQQQQQQQQQQSAAAVTHHGLNGMHM